MTRKLAWFCCAAFATLTPSWLGAQELKPIDLTKLERGTSAFPSILQPYHRMELPPVKLENSPLLQRLLVDGRLRVSLNEFLQLVAQNSLDLEAARYDFAVAQVDILRAKSGQAARGTPSSPLPGALFAGAIGAGVNSTAALSSGGTGGAAISTQGKLVAFGARGNFDPTFSMNLSYDRLVNPLNTVKVAGNSSLTIPTTVLQSRFQQQLPYGTSYSVSFNLQRQTSTQAGLLFNPALSSFFAFQVYQPLLNGFGVALNTRFITVAETDRAVVRETFHTTLNNTLSTAANDYWDFIALRENVLAAEDAVTTAQQQVDENRQRVELGTMTPLDVVAAESQLASSRAQLMKAQMQRDQQAVVLKTLITKTAAAGLDAAVIESTDALPLSADITVPVLGTSIASALATRSSIRGAELSLDNQKVAEHYTHKNLLPTLSAYVALDLYGLAPGTNPAVRELTEWQYPEYSIGFTWAVPVYNRSAQADDVRARLETQQAETALLRTRSQVTNQVQSAIVSLVQGRAGVDAAQRALEASRTVFQAEQDKLRAGISTPYKVTLAQRDLLSAEAAAIQARVNLAKALVAEQIAVGGFLESHGIELDETIRGSRFTGGSTTESQ